MIGAWLRFFRVVNLPTVPGDVFAGTAAVLAFSGRTSAPDVLTASLWAALASVFLYLFGLADNDIVGARYDKGRPIPDGEISPRAAKVARALCLVAALGCGAAGRLPQGWWMFAWLLVCDIVVYNRCKRAVLMGLCRGLDVLCGAAAAGMAGACPATFTAVGVAVLWTLYITVVTAYSTGEEADPARRARVGLLIGGIVYLQLLALIAFTLMCPAANPLLLIAAVLLIILRALKRALPKVYAS